ncbi:hypothetical protein E3J79_03515 [Candidatus Dependentiae bacterium]|nr:MAG: hypothetical protein E3J79_03515 [Candidatus Dependentiae bacterium]
MNELAVFFHYGTIASIVAINSLGVGIGEGLASSAALDAINLQPNSKYEISRTAILGMALIETAAIMGVTISFILLLGTRNTAYPLCAGIADLGIALAISLPGFAIGIVSALPAREACLAIARQPFFAQRILRFMLLTQSINQTPIVFGFIIAMFINTQAASCTNLIASIRLLATGICIGVGSIGPSIGLALFSRRACQGLGINRKAYNKLFSFTLISNAIIETPIIFALIIALMILFITDISNATAIKGISLLSAAICMGIGTISVGISSGITAAAACHQIAKKPELHSILSRVSMFSQGLIDTFAIYALLIAILLILIP